MSHAGTDRIRVLRVIARLNVGGPARHVAALAALDQRGFETRVVHGSLSEGEASMAPLIEAAGASTEVIPELGRRIDWKADATALWKLTRLCRRFDPHIVHTHTAKAGTLGRVGVTLGRLAGGRRPALIHTFHGHVFEGYFGTLGSAAARTTERALARLCDRLVVISERQKQDIVHRFRIAPEARTRVIPLGLDLEAFSALPPASGLRAELGAGPADTLIGTIGRLVPVKNHELFLQAARETVDRGLNARFVIAGGGELEGSLRALAARLGLEARVHWLGWRQDLAALYAGLDIITLSSNNEGTPVALIEAMAAGRAVAATDVGGVGDVIAHDRTGLLVPPRDASALASAWIRLAGDPGLRASLGRAAQGDVLARFSQARLVDDVERLYREVMRQRS